MKRQYKLALIVLVALGVILLAALFLRNADIPVLNPKGHIALEQRNLMVTATLLMLIVVIPVYIMTFAISWKYREGNTKAKYSPDWDHSRLAESVWWGLPLLIILILSVITWQSSHALDPYKPLKSDKQPITIQVVALPWKWLFIYPDQNIATVNYIQFPEDTPINFEITADAPMNSFWIPQLGGQVYAMAGMKTKLHLIADEPGSYNGVSANLSGQGFAGMKFTAKATSQADFDLWIKSVKQSPAYLGLDEYRRLAQPSEYHPVIYYASRDEDLYDRIIKKFMLPTDAMPTQPPAHLHTHSHSHTDES